MMMMIYPKINAMERVEFELAYYDLTVQHRYFSLSFVNSMHFAVLFTEGNAFLLKPIYQEKIF